MLRLSKAFVALSALLIAVDSFAPRSVPLLLVPPQVLNALPPKAPSERAVALSRLSEQVYSHLLCTSTPRIADEAEVLLLRRRSDVEMYDKIYADSSYPEDTPTYLRLGFDAPKSPGAVSWDATCVQMPTSHPSFTPGTPLFLAMNRFPVKPDEDSRRLFEEVRNASLIERIYHTSLTRLFILCLYS